MLTDKKIAAYSKIVAGLPDVPSPAMSPLQIKQWFDTAPEEIRVAFNALIDALGATTTGDSGAEAIGIEPIVGISAANVQNALEQLRVLINDAVAGAIPDGSIGPAKLSFDPATQSELDSHAADFTTHIEYALATGAANTYAVTLTPAPTSYVRGMGVSVEINSLNTGASTININGLGPKSIKKSNGSDVAAGSLKVGIIYTLRYNGTNFILQGEGGEYGNATAAQVLAPNTFGTDAGVIPGTMPDRAGDTAALASSVSGTTLKLRASAGYRDGVDDNVTITDANFVASKILAPNVLFGLPGTLTAGKKFASGSVTSSATTQTFDTFGSSYYVTVTGLSFLPSTILIYRSTGAATAVSTNAALAPTGTSIIMMPGSSNIPLTAPAEITSTSFLLPIGASAASTLHKWVAYE